MKARGAVGIYPKNFMPLLEELLAFHPGLAFLEGTPEFQVLSTRHFESVSPRSSRARGRIPLCLYLAATAAATAGCSPLPLSTHELI